MRKDKITQSIICHEWGHALTAYLLQSGMGSIETIELYDDIYCVQGHTTFLQTSFTERQELMILFGGIAAERVCGYSTVLMHSGTDADKIRAIVPDKQERQEIGDSVIVLLMPYRTSLEWLVKTTLEHYPTERDENNRIYYRVFRDELASWIADAIKFRNE